MNVRSLGSALTAAVQGLAQQEQQVAAAAQNLTTAFAVAQTGLAEPALAPAPTAAEIPVNDGLAARATGGDVSEPLVSLLAPKTAYKASLKAVQVTADLQRETIDALGRRKAVTA